jgi:hypothetical protein
MGPGRFGYRLAANEPEFHTIARWPLISVRSRLSSWPRTRKSFRQESH